MSERDVADPGAGFDWLTSDGTTLWWLESRPSAGRSVLIRWDAGRLAAYSVASGSIGSALHAYGGQPYTVLEPDQMEAVDASTGQLVGLPHDLDSRYVYGDLAPDDGDLLAVRESEAGDDLVAVRPGRPDARVLLSVDGFVASPRRSAGRLAWMQWNSTVMPWDSCEVWVADYATSGRIERARRVAGGPDESAVQPTWSTDGSLYFMSDRSGWWNLYRWRDGVVEAVAPMAAECATAPWESGYANYVLLRGGRLAMTAQVGPRQQLLIVEPDGGVRAVALPYTSIKPYLVGCGDRVGLIGASSTHVPEVALVAVDGTHAVEVIRRPAQSVEAGAVSVPEVMRVDAAGGPVSVLFYPPVPAVESVPPLIVRPHAGPTYHNELRLDPEVQFFTSRGFAVADVDYRGSTGYGRAFRKALDGNWGRFDVEDSRAAALHLIAGRRVRADAVFISGASAGGYTALKAVCDDGPFVLAVARSAIVDPQLWRTTAPRFQRPHAAILASATSPVDAGQVQRPVLLVHGADDAVAPVKDAEVLAQALRVRGLLAGMLKFEGVGHYLSAAAQRHALEAELAAYREVLDRGGVITPE
ncbi:prolyl oligopeptidase family serine peptidase [Dactylosporangium sp. NPDC051485]|uniref:prolyl oligopeptidase family serine peptidase n=1 Tax=Dactylosporangium sp. NPDC051485 TaxID=3154846 RepID=UPI0034169E78